MTTIETTEDARSLGSVALERDARELLGHVMAFVAVTVGFAALGAYLGRNLSTVTGLVLFVIALGCVFGLHSAAAKGREQLAIGLLFGLGLLLGLGVAPVVADFAEADPSALWQAAGATAAFVAGFGAYGRRRIDCRSSTSSSSCSTCSAASATDPKEQLMSSPSTPLPISRRRFAGRADATTARAAAVSGAGG